MNSIVSRLLLIFSCSVAMTSCEHKDLCYDHGHSVEINVKFKWDAAPDADPNTMVVNFFSLDGKHVARREFSSRDGGVVKVDEGEYKILFHNGEMETVNEDIDSYDLYGLVTNDESLLAPMSRDMKAPPRPEASAEEPVKATAETVWAGKCEYVMVERDKKGQVVELYPEEATAHYTVEVVNVENLRDNINISAALSGLSERLNISRSAAAGKPVTVPFSIDRKDDRTIEAQFLTFGHCPDDNAVPHILSIYTSGKVYFNFEVTDQVHNAPDDKNIYIKIDGLTLPKEGETVTPAIDDWGEAEDVDIKML